MNNSKLSLIMIDDEVDFLNAYRAGLSDEFQVHPFTHPVDALNHLDRIPADAVILDYHIPGCNAWETYKAFRQRDFGRPVLILTGETNSLVKLEGLDTGIDDYLQKPISVQELSAYLRNRINNYKRRNPQILKLKNLEMNLQDPQIHVNEKPVMLTNKEFEILRLLVTNPNSIITKNIILEKIWPDVAVEESNIDTHMSNLRKKLGGFECYIKTIKKIGYVLRA